MSTEETAVTTPQDTVNNPHNFGPASKRDSHVYTCQRPGGDMGAQTIPATMAVEATVSALRPHGIENVIILMADEELQSYEEPGLIAAYQAAGWTVHHIPHASPQSYRTIMETLDQVEGPVVAHCTHGAGRSGQVAAGWLMHRYGLSLDQAVKETLATAREYGVERIGAPSNLEAWISLSRP